MYVGTFFGHGNIFLDDVESIFPDPEIIFRTNYGTLNHIFSAGGLMILSQERCRLMQKAVK